MILRLRLAFVAGTRAPRGQGVDEVLLQAEQVAAASHKGAPRVRWLLARAEFLEPDEAARAAREAGPLALARGLHGSRISAEVLLARTLLQQGKAQAAVPRVRIALARAAGHQPDVVDSPKSARFAHQMISPNFGGHRDVSSRRA